MADSPGNRLSGIELLRFMAALTVLIAHYRYFYSYGFNLEHFTLEGQPLYGLLWPFYRYGTRAVEVFWCLSGFIFFFKYADVIGARKIPAKRFFWLRFSRLYPLHLLTLLAIVPLQWAYIGSHGTYYVAEFNDLRHFVLNLLFAQYWGFQEGFSFNGPSWSVSVEVLVYLFFFVATFLFRADLFTVLICLAACVGADHYLGTEPVILRCIFFFYLGGLSCLAYRAIAARARAVARTALVAGSALLVLAAYEFVKTGDVDWVLNLGVPVALAVLAILSASVGTRLAACFDALGNLTYASYMIHFPLQILTMLFVGMLGVRLGFADSPYFLFAYLLGVFGISHVVYRRIELPLQDKIRSRILGKKSAA